MQNINKLVASQTFYSKQFRTSEYVTISICIAIDDTPALVIILESLSNTKRFPTLERYNYLHQQSNKYPKYKVSHPNIGDQIFQYCMERLILLVRHKIVN